MITIHDFKKKMKAPDSVIKEVMGKVDIQHLKAIEMGKVQLEIVDPSVVYGKDYEEHISGRLLRYLQSGGKVAVLRKGGNIVKVLTSCTSNPKKAEVEGFFKYKEEWVEKRVVANIVKVHASDFEKVCKRDMFKERVKKKKEKLNKKVR